MSYAWWPNKAVFVKTECSSSSQRPTGPLVAGIPSVSPAMTAWEQGATRVGLVCKWKPWTKRQKPSLLRYYSIATWILMKWFHFFRKVSAPEFSHSVMISQNRRSKIIPLNRVLISKRDGSEQIVTELRLAGGIYWIMKNIIIHPYFALPFFFTLPPSYTHMILYYQLLIILMSQSFPPIAISSSEKYDEGLKGRQPLVVNEQWACFSFWQWSFLWKGLFVRPIDITFLIYTLFA